MRQQDATLARRQPLNDYVCARLQAGMGGHGFQVLLMEEGRGRSVRTVCTKLAIPISSVGRLRGNGRAVSDYALVDVPVGDAIPTAMVIGLVFRLAH